MTTQHLTAPAGDVNSNAEPAAGQVEANPDAACAAPWCELRIAAHPLVGVEGVPEGPVHVNGLVYGNARCAYQTSLHGQGRLCEACGGDNALCSHTRSARGWTTQVTRTVVFPARASHP